MQAREEAMRLEAEAPTARSLSLSRAKSMSKHTSISSHNTASQSVQIVARTPSPPAAESAPVQVLKPDERATEAHRQLTEMAERAADLEQKLD